MVNGVGGIVKDPLTAGNVIYHAVGILETEQETIIATRNAVVVQTEVSQTTSRDRTSTTGRVISNLRQRKMTERKIVIMTTAAIL